MTTPRPMTVRGSSPGPGVDSSGSPVIDPTSNVLQLVEAATQRLDDLRSAESRRIDERMDFQGEHFREIGRIREAYDDRLRIAEASRIDAIRAVDVGAVAVAADRAVQQATVLASQVATSADTLRTLVANSATQTAAALTQIIEPIIARLAQLEKAQYEGAGKSTVTDPLTQQLLSEVKALRAENFTNAGERQGAGDYRTEQRLSLGAVVAVVGAILALVSIIIAMNLLTR